MSRQIPVTLTNMCMVYDGDKVLVQDRTDPDWPGITFPGGHIESGESFCASVIREVFEETGLYIIFCGTDRVVSHYSPKPGVEKDAVYFLATIRNNQNVKLQKEEVAD